MKYDIENKKVNEILDELGEEYKKLLIEKALSQHQEYDVDQINLSTLIKLDEKAKDSLLIDERKNRRSQLLAILSIIGLIYALFGLVLFIYFEFGNSLRLAPMSKMSLMLVIFGLVAIMFSILMRSIPYSSHYRSTDTSKYFNYKIVNVWKQIEGLLVQLTPLEKNMSLSSMISNLMELKLLSESDAAVIKKILNLRNQIVHSNSIEKSYTTSEIQALLRDSDSIIKKLKRFENT